MAAKDFENDLEHLKSLRNEIAHVKGNLQYAGPEVLHQGCSNFPVHEQPYRLVVDRTAITSIVTWSDLLKLPVTVLAFSLVAQLELAMNARIKEKYGDENGWLELLATKDKKKIVGRLQKLQLENLALSVLELADFSDKARVLHERLAATDFENDLEHLSRSGTR